MGEALNETEVKTLLETLKNRFEANKKRHPNLKWQPIENKLLANLSMLQVVFEMERTEGEPDVIMFQDGSIGFVDCCKESPKGRRSICYDREALNVRKNNKPASSAMDMAKEIGIELLNEQQYRELQRLDSFDLKTSSWIVTPVDIRKLGGALFCDRRYNNVFTYHNGAESYYAARGFRGVLFIQ